MEITVSLVYQSNSRPILLFSDSDELLRLRDLVNVAHSTINGTTTPLALNDDFYDLRDTVGVVELLILRILNFRIPRPTFFNYLVQYLYTIEKWFHGRPSQNNRNEVVAFQAVSRTAGKSENSKFVAIYCFRMIFATPNLSRGVEKLARNGALFHHGRYF